MAALVAEHCGGFGCVIFSVGQVDVWMLSLARSTPSLHIRLPFASIFIGMGERHDLCSDISFAFKSINVGSK
jgi:hypothetical protein